MKKGIRFITLLVLAALALAGLPSSQRAESASVAPSWDLLAGVPGTCTSSGFSTTVYVNAPDLASEQGTLTAPGYGQLGYTVDSAFSGVGNFSFFVFVSAPYSLPANTPLTLTVTTYNGPNYTGGVSFIDSLTWDCTTGEILASQETVPGVPGCDVLMPISSTAVVGSFVADAPVYWKPGELTNPLVTITAGKTAWVLGQDASGQYYKIVWACDLVWVPKASMGPNYDAVWNGKPLPTEIVQ